MRIFITSLIGFICLLLPTKGFGKSYTPENLPMVYTNDKTKHVTNPDHILSAKAVAQMDSLLWNLEQKKGVQSIVVVVERIEGGDCYEFAMRLGNNKGVGNKKNTGIIILLSTQDRCYYILTGQGLEGTLPDAICRRIENRKMVPYLKTGNWDAAMVNTVEAVCGIIQGDSSLLNEKSSESNEGSVHLTFFLIMFVFMTIIMIMSWFRNRKNNTCPQCGKYPMQRTNSNITIDRVAAIEHHAETYKCPHCHHTTNRYHDEPWDNGTGFGGTPFVGGIPHRRGFGGLGGGFGGGSFGGGGAGGRF